MKIAVIGAGFSGLLTAYYLTGRADVTVYEKETYTGGLISGIEYEGARIDKYNLFLSRNDRELIGLVNDLGLEDELLWADVNQAKIMDSCFFRMSMPWDIFSFSNLNFAQKCMLGRFILKNKLIKNADSLRETKVKDWIINECGEKIFEVFFEPLLKFKFGEFNDVSAAYLWARFNEEKRNRIGYFRNGTSLLTCALEDTIKRAGEKVILGKPVNEIILEDNKCRVITGRQDECYDAVISCIPANETAFLCRQCRELEPLKKLEYLSVGSFLIVLSQPLKPGYWLFTVEDKNNGGLNVVVDTSAVNGRNIIYFPVYRRQKPGQMIDEDEIFQQCLKALKRINPEFSKEWIKDKFFFTNSSVEPVLSSEFFEQLTGSGKKGIYIQEMAAHPDLLKTLNTAVIKSKIIANKVLAQGKVS